MTSASRRVDALDRRGRACAKLLGGEQQQAERRSACMPISVRLRAPVSIWSSNAKPKIDDRDRADDQVPAHAAHRASRARPGRAGPRATRARCSTGPGGSTGATAATVPSCVTAVNAAPGSSQPAKAGTIRRCAERRDRQELRQPLHDPEDDGFEGVHGRRSTVERRVILDGVRVSPSRRSVVSWPRPCSPAGCGGVDERRVRRRAGRRAAVRVDRGLALGAARRRPAGGRARAEGRARAARRAAPSPSRAGAEPPRAARAAAGRRPRTRRRCPTPTTTSLVKAEVLKNGVALPPLEAPPEVRAIFEAGNTIARSPVQVGRRPRQVAGQRLRLLGLGLLRARRGGPAQRAARVRPAHALGQARQGQVDHDLLEPRPRLHGRRGRALRHRRARPDRLALDQRRHAPPTATSPGTRRASEPARLDARWKTRAGG